ncbi:MAG TPA: ATP-binding protein, partial [Phototrophicaceae bacterium]|nr:ATP-binding protein [Phototrophicaceae bacterium]
SLIPDLQAVTSPISELGKLFLSEGIRSFLNGPLVVQGQLIGTLSLASNTPDFFISEHKQIVQEVADQLAVALHQSRLYEQIQQHNLELEQRVAERSAELQQSEARYRAIIENQLDLVHRYLPGGILTFVNQTYCKHFNRTAEELLGTNLFALLPPEERSLLEQNIASLNSQNPFITTELRELTVDGQERWFHWSDRILFDEHGHFVEYQGVGRDITERKLAEVQLRQMLDQAMKLNELRSRYLSMAAHDLRNPLSVIQNAVSMLQDYGDKLTGERKQTRYTQIYDMIKLMVAMLDDILMLGQTEVGNYAFNPIELNVVKFCENIIEELKLVADTVRQIDFLSQGDCSTAYFDPKLLRHILSNLLSNALKYSPDDKVVTFILECGSSQTTFHIQDRGMGIPVDDQTKLFDVFHRGSNTRQVAGTGLGMAIVKRSVDLHGGTITFESQEGVGTTFNVVLPAYFNL